MPTHWYTLHSHPNKEDLLWHQLESQGIVSFYPRLRVNPVNPRARKIRPYFPGYLFVNADLEVVGLSTFQWMPYTTGLVTFGDEPATVPEAFIHVLRQRVSDIAAVGGERFASLSSGDLVTVTDGPFAGYEAIFDTRISGSERVRVLLKMLVDRTIPIEMNVGQIERKKAPKSKP